MKQPHLERVSRRGLLTMSAAAVGGALLSRPALAASSFGALKTIEAGVLNVAYAEAGPFDGLAVILLHGWPYDIYSYADVAPVLAAAGYRVFIPYLRGYGATRFLSSETVRNGQQAALAVDVVAFMDALKIDKAILAGFDWGARTANIVAALWPQRCKALVSVSGYLVGSVEINKAPLPPAAELAWWYQFYFATERGVAGYEKYCKEFSRLIWQLASPKWRFDDETFNRSAAAFDNPDHVSIVIHNYRWRLGLAEGESKYDELEKRLAAAPIVTVPAITLEGDANGAPHPDAAAYTQKFTGWHLPSGFLNASPVGDLSCLAHLSKAVMSKCSVSRAATALLQCSPSGRRRLNSVVFFSIECALIPRVLPNRS